MDIFPTVVELVGGTPPAGLDGRSFAPILRGRATKAREFIFLAYRDVQRAYREGRHKLIVYPKIGKRQLFDLARDPDEVRDLSGLLPQQVRIAGMLEMMREAQAEFGDTDPLIVDHPAGAEFHPPEGEVLERLLKRAGVERRSP